VAAVVYLGVIVAGILVWAIFAYNRLVHWRVQAEESWHDIDTQLKRRWDLIPKVVDVVKGYASHESGVFESIAQARARALDAEYPSDQVQAEEVLNNALFSLFVVAEDYPQLQASESFLEMQRTLAETEDVIQHSRKFYNAAVRELNAAVAAFPKNLIAAIFKFESRDFYALPDEVERLAPRISL
jgi:LemA protein